MRSFVVVLAASAYLAGFAVLPTNTFPLVGMALAQPADAEKQAFEATKELGTVEAWDAFLANYPSGFHAELARAYVKKLTGAATPGRPSSPAPTDESIQPAHEVSCDQAKTLRSEQSNKAAKIRFVNESGATLIIQWIDFKGALKEYAELQPGAELTQETYVTHPWIAAYQEGSCRQLFLPAPGISVARLRPESELSNKATTVKQPPNSKRSDDADPPLKCAKNYKKVEGKCVLLQNCGANAYRSPEGDCYCNKNYRMQNGECVLKQAVKCSRHEVYSSSMGQCIPKAAMCSKNEVYSSSMGQCVPKSLGQ